MTGQSKLTEQHIEIIERLYRSFSNGIRNVKATGPRKWLQERSLSIEATGASFNSGQIHHRKSKEFKANLVSVGFMKQSKVPTNNGQTPYTLFGNYAVLFPLRDKKGRVANFYAQPIRHWGLRTKDGSPDYMNLHGLYPGYPHELTEKLYLVHGVMEAATVLESQTLDNREAVLALFDGEFLPQHEEALRSLPNLKELIAIDLKKPNK